MDNLLNHLTEEEHEARLQLMENEAKHLAERAKQRREREQAMRAAAKKRKKRKKRAAKLKKQAEVKAREKRHATPAPVFPNRHPALPSGNGYNAATAAPRAPRCLRPRRGKCYRPRRTG